MGTTGRYAIGPSTQVFLDACAGAIHRTLLATEPIALPFPVTFFGCTDSAAWVSTNGILGIGSASSNEYNNLCLPNAEAPRGTILAFWDDLAMNDGVCTAMFGAPGDRAFVVQWSNANFYAGNTSSRLDFEVVLHEGSDVIDVVYRTMTDGTEPGRGSGTSATIGVVDAFGAGAVQYGCNAPVIHAPQALRFTPR
ncbi:MAG: hypothetical protein WCJ30_24010 [Deltaproteobacteria bacterium]